MKRSNILLLIITLITTIAVMFALPLIVRKATVSNDKYPFVYYSSQLKDLCLIDYSNKETPMHDLSGRAYTTHEFDSLVPLLNYRQLMSDGLLPDSICGVSAEPRNLMMHSVVMRYDPKNMLKPTVGLYAMLETMPTRVGLKQPTDMFRIDNKIEFLDVESNSVDYQKSERFQKEMEKCGYQFPTTWAVGDANTRKSFDEGYFCLDAKGELFHVKMVNGRPFVKNTNASDSIDIAYFASFNSSTRRFYGYILSTTGDMYILESDDLGGYKPLRLDIETIDIKNESVMVMGNILYWTIAITSRDGRRYYALKSDDLTSVANHSIARELNRWDNITEYLMPLTIEFQSDNSEYVYPRVTFAGVKSLIVSFILAAISLFIFKTERLKVKLFSMLLIAVTGVAGLVALVVLPKYNR